jgi:NAD(P)H-dependent FMN reductase
MKLQVIVGTTRPSRVTDTVATWVATTAKELPDTEVEIVDLEDYPMPFLDESISPQYNPDRQPNPQAEKWLKKLGEADAFVIVTPEYNRSIPGVLKNALDYIDFQFARKPVALVAHGSTGGAQAIATLRIALPGLLAAIIPQATFLVGRPTDVMDEAGVLREEIKQNPYGPHAALMKTLEETKWYSDALSAARKSS